MSDLEKPYYIQLKERHNENVIVLSKEEYTDFIILRQNHEFIREKAKKLQEENEHLYRNICKFKDIVREGTARDILNKLKSKQVICSCKEDNFVYMLDIIKVIKQCGVDVEE